MISSVRRTSIVTEDMALSKKFYCEGIGLNVFYENIIENDVSGKLMGMESPKVHLVSLNANDETTGMVGLMKFLRPEGYSTREEVKKQVGRTDIVLVFRTDDVRAVHKRLLDLGFAPCNTTSQAGVGPEL